MSNNQHGFPPDEFDALGQNSPVGIHRQPPTLLRRLAPFLVVLVLAPALAYGAVWAISEWGSGDYVPKPPQSTATDVPDFDDEDPVEPEPTATQEPTQEPTVEPTPDPTPVLTTKVEVLNATRVTGLAGRVTDGVKELGFANAEAGNFRGDRPSETVIYFRNADLEFTANYIGQSLEITKFELNPEASSDIVVILAGDFN